MIFSSIFFVFFKFSFFGLVEGWKAKNSPKWQKIMSVALNRHLWYTSVKWYLQGFFYFFKILNFWVVRRVKGQNGPHWQKNSVPCTLYLRNHTSCDLDLCYTCVKGNRLKLRKFPSFVSLIVSLFSSVVIINLPQLKY